MGFVLPKVGIHPQRYVAFLVVHRPIQAGLTTNYCVKTAPTLGGSHAASWNLSDLPNERHSDIFHQMSLGFQLRNQPRLRSFHHSAQAEGGGIEHVVNGVCKVLRKIVDALTPQAHDTRYFKRRGWVKVPRGHSVSEREWAELESGKRVGFSPRIGVSAVGLSITSTYPPLECFKA